jgi:hypothetical protein
MAVAFGGEDPSPTPPHKGEGLNSPYRCAQVRQGECHGFSPPLVGEMAGRPERVMPSVIAIE